MHISKENYVLVKDQSNASLDKNQSALNYNSVSYKFLILKLRKIHNTFALTGLNFIPYITGLTKGGTIKNITVKNVYNVLGNVLLLIVSVKNQKRHRLCSSER